MESHFDIDTLIAALHPHVVMSRFKYDMHPPNSLRPSKDTEIFYKLAQAFATLFSFHPGCNATAVAVQSPVSGHPSFSLCLSSSTPPDFQRNLEKWLAHFTSLQKESRSRENGHRDGICSPSECDFILHTYKICYPEMKRQIAEHGFGDWSSFLEKREVVPAETFLQPTENEVRETQQYAEELRAFSDLVLRFAEGVSHNSLGSDEEVLQFHELCMAIKGMRSDPGFLQYLNEYVHCAVIGPGLAYFNLPLAVSDIIALSCDAKICLDNVKKWVILDSSKGARRFSAVMTEASLAECFREGEHYIRWKAVMAAFKRNWEVGLRGYGNRYQWDAEKNIFSTAAPVPLHPEIALIQYLLERGDRGARTHIACSRTPCYASGVYAVAVNKSLGTRFTMDVDKPEWCQLDEVEPWVLPEDAPEGVVASMKKHLLRDLDMLAVRWEEERGFGVDYDTIASDDELIWG